MADNNKMKKQSVQNAMMAEIIVTELEKFTTSHEVIMAAAQKLLTRYNDIRELIDLMEKRDYIIAKSIRDLQIASKQYIKLTNLSMGMSSALKEVKEQGIGMKPDSLDKITEAVSKGNKPIREHIKWLTYGVITLLGMLLLLALLL